MRREVPEGDGIIAVRPENVSLSKNGGMLKGTVRHRFYMGDAVDYRIETAAGMIRVMTHAVRTILGKMERRFILIS